MKIAVANLTSGGLSGGYRKYLARLMPLMAGDPRVTSLTVFVPAASSLALGEGIDLRPWAPGDARRGYAGLSRELATLAPDVVFVPTARHARFGAVPTVTMVRNMEPLEIPFGGNTVKEGLKNVARAWEARRACRRATRVIAVSEHVREFITSRWHIDPARVGMVYHGVDRPGSPDNPPQHSGGDVTLFTAGSIRPARGLEDIVRALPLLHRDVRLVIGGRVDPGCEAYGHRLRALCKELEVVDRVTWAGELSGGEMAAAFRRCTVFVMTSRAEACPNIALEAMSHGCASVSVDRAPMPEFFTDAARYYPVGDAGALAARLEDLLGSSALRAALQQHALNRISAFSWQATKDRTIAELERARARS